MSCERRDVAMWRGSGCDCRRDRECEENSLVAPCVPPEELEGVEVDDGGDSGLNGELGTAAVWQDAGLGEEIGVSQPGN